MASQAGTFIRQDGVTSRYHARISAEEWELHKTMIEDLHNDGETREDIRNALIQERNFRPRLVCCICDSTIGVILTSC